MALSKEPKPTTASGPVTLESVGIELAEWRELTFGQRIQRLLEFTKVSQVQLSRRSTIKRPTLGRMLQGKRPPKREDVERIASALEVEWSLLAEGLELGPAPEAEQRSRVLQQVHELRKQADEAELAKVAAQEATRLALEMVQQREEEHKQREAKLLAEYQATREGYEGKIAELENKTSSLVLRHFLAGVEHRKQVKQLEAEKDQLRKENAVLWDYLQKAQRALAQSQGNAWLAAMVGAVLGLGGAALIAGAEE